MKNYIDAAITRSRTTVSIFIVTLLAGFASYLAIPIEMYPDIKFPLVITTIIHEGISPEDSERLLSKPAELELKLIDGIVEVTSFQVRGPQQL
jgi:multidrug efflux pump